MSTKKKSGPTDSKKSGQKDQEFQPRDRKQELVDKLIARMEQDEATGWQKPWFTCNVLPFNPATGTRYKGINAVSLLTEGYDDPRFYTFKNIERLQAEKPDATIKLKKGSKGVPIFKAVDVEINSKEAKEAGDATATATTDSSSSPDKKTIRVMAYAGTVFNASCIEGLEPYRPSRENKVESFAALDRVQEAMQADGVSFTHSSRGRATYSPVSDEVHMPEKALFKSTDGYYSTLLHEIGHSTGHEKRLARKGIVTSAAGDKSTQAYAFEELVAELHSYFQGAEYGLPYSGAEHDNHAAYIKSWVQALRNDKNYIFKAAAQASKACDYVNNLTREHVQRIEQQQHEEQGYKAPEQTAGGTPAPTSTSGRKLGM